MDLRQKITKKSYLSSKSRQLFKQTSKLIPCGVQTLSKMPNKFVEGQYPIYLESGSGAWVWDNQGSSYIDYPCALGTNLLGYAYPEINDAIIQQLHKGSLFTLPSILETKLAEKLNKLIPCAETMRFLKTGSEATSAAVKIARAYTSKMGIAYCGYHGWHDWFTCDTSKDLGIPRIYKGLIQKFEYNNIESLENLFKKACWNLGVVILEPYIYDEPINNFLQQVINLSHKHNALVIFDEIVTGFRTPKFSAQKYFNAVPDLACFGKAMANGLPISVVCGKREVMKVLEGDCFVSSTFGGELLSISAALKTIEVCERENVPVYLERMGKRLKDGYNKIAEALRLDTKCIGLPNRTMFMFPSAEHKSLFWQECINRGVLFGYAQFINYSHKSGDIDYTLEVIKQSLEFLAEYWSNPLKVLRGKPAKEVFRVLATRS